MLFPGMLLAGMAGAERAVVIAIDLGVKGAGRAAGRIEQMNDLFDHVGGGAMLDQVLRDGISRLWVFSNPIRALEFASDQVVEPYLDAVEHVSLFDLQGFENIVSL